MNQLIEFALKEDQNEILEFIMKEHPSDLIMYLNSYYQENLIFHTTTVSLTSCSFQSLEMIRKFLSGWEIDVNVSNILDYNRVFYNLIPYIGNAYIVS